MSDGELVDLVLRTTATNHFKLLNADERNVLRQKSWQSIGDGAMQMKLETAMVFLACAKLAKE